MENQPKEYGTHAVEVLPTEVNQLLANLDAYLESMPKDTPRQLLEFAWTVKALNMLVEQHWYKHCMEFANR